MRKYCNYTSEQKKTNDIHFMKIDGNIKNIEIVKEELEKFNKDTKVLFDKTNKIDNVLKTKTKVKDFDALLKRFNVFSRVETV